MVITYKSSDAEARDVVASIESKGRRGVALHLDTTDIGSFGALVERLRAELPNGTFDVLVNNAGTALYSLPSGRQRPSSTRSSTFTSRVRSS